MKQLKKILPAGLFFLMFSLTIPQHNVNAFALTHIASWNTIPQNIAYYTSYRDPCRFYSFRSTHPRRCAHWYRNDYDYDLIIPYLWPRDHYRRDYSPYRHHIAPFPLWRYGHHHRHHRFGGHFGHHKFGHRFGGHFRGGFHRRHR